MSPHIPRSTADREAALRAEFIRRAKAKADLGRMAAESFAQGWDTNRIASVYQVDESEVYNSLAHARGQKTERRPSYRR